jgi:hypothetical protein
MPLKEFVSLAAFIRLLRALAFFDMRMRREAQ